MHQFNFLLLATSIAVFATMLNASVGSAQDKVSDKAPPSAANKLGWPLALHSYTFQKFSIFDAIDKTQALGLKYMTISGSVSLDGKTKVPTFTLSDAEWAKIQQKLDAAGIKLLNMGVVKLSADEAQSRIVFDFAKKAGIDCLVSEPEPDAFNTIEKLCKEYNIKVALHNHPQPSRYWNPDAVLSALKDRTPLMGACADTGHWVRSGLDPVAAVQKLQGRILCFHFKDLTAKPPDVHDVPWGTGVGQVKKLLAEMKRQNFQGAFAIEYEYNWENSMPDIAECIQFFNRACEELTAAP